MGPGSRVRILGIKGKNHQHFQTVKKTISIFNIHLQDCCWSICHIPYDLDLGSEILISGEDIRSRAWPNIAVKNGISVLAPVYQNVTFGFRYYLNDLTYNLRQVLISRLLCAWCQPEQNLDLSLVQFTHCIFLSTLCKKVC